MMQITGMNTPDYKNRGLKASDICFATGIYFAGRGVITIFLTVLAPSGRAESDGFSRLLGLGFLALGFLLFKIGVQTGPRSLYRTGSSRDWDDCVHRVLENAKIDQKKIPSESPESRTVTDSQDIDIQYHL